MAVPDPMDDLLDAFVGDLPEEAEVDAAANRIARTRRPRVHTLWWVAAAVLVGAGAAWLGTSPPTQPMVVEASAEPTPVVHSVERVVVDTPPVPKTPTAPTSTPEPVVAEESPAPPEEPDAVATTERGLDLADGTVATWRGDELVLHQGQVSFFREGDVSPRAARVGFANIPAVAWPNGTVFVAAAVGDVGLLSVQSGEVFLMERGGGPLARLGPGESVAVARLDEQDLAVVSLVGLAPDDVASLLPEAVRSTAGLGSSIVDLRLAALSATAKAQLLRTEGG
jgi:hypothetical protein